MKRFKRYIALFISMLFICTPSYAKESNIDGYIVKYKNMDEEIVLPEPPISLFGTENEVEYVIPNIIFELFEGEYLPCDAYYKNQWNLDMICASEMWSAGGYGNGVRVGVIDTGIYPHEDLADCTLTGAAFKQVSGDSIDVTDTLDTQGHGTYVSGIIAAAWNEYTVAGIAKNAQIVPLKAFAKNSSGNWSASLFALKNAIKAAVDDFDCDIINMSLGVAKGANSALAEEYFEDTINYAYEKGAIIVAAVGNNENSTINLPAGFENVIGVGSVDSNKARSSFSNYNSSVYTVSPGSNIYTSGITSGKVTNIVSGTSFSAPTVAAIAALAKSVNPNLTNAQFMELIKTSCEDLGDTGYDTSFGYGLLRCDLLLKNMIEEGEYIEKKVEHLDGGGTYSFYNNSETPKKILAFSYKYGENVLDKLTAWRFTLDENKRGFSMLIPDKENSFKMWNAVTHEPYRLNIR